MNWLAGPPWIPAAIAFVAGALLGRFLNRCIDRVPRHEWLSEQLAAPFRVTPAERRLRAARTVAHRLPVIGWLLPGNPLSRGRGEDLRQAAVEFANGLLLAALLWTHFPNGLIANPPDPFAVIGLEFLAPAGGSLTLQIIRFGLHAVLVQSLLVASVIDLKLMIIPDATTVPAALLALILGTAAGGIWLVPVWYEDLSLLALLDLTDGFETGIYVPAFVYDHPHWHGFAVAAVGLLIGGGLVWSVRIIGHWALGREAMGFGDVILMAMMGSVLGWQPVLVVFFLAPVCAIAIIVGAVVTRTSREFPFGPWLSLAAVVVIVFWQIIWPYAGRIFLMGRLIPLAGILILVLLAILLRGMRLIRREEPWYLPHAGEWTSADQLHYLSQENPPAGRRDGEWPGVASGQGTLGERRWRGATCIGTPNWRAWQKR